MKKILKTFLTFQLLVACVFSQTYDPVNISGIYRSKDTVHDREYSGPIKKASWFFDGESSPWCVDSFDLIGRKILHRSYFNNKIEYEKRIVFDSNGFEIKNYSVDSADKWLYGTSITFPDSFSKREVYSQLDGKHYSECISIYDQINRFIGSYDSASYLEHPIKSYAFYDSIGRLTKLFSIERGDTFRTTIDYGYNGKRMLENHFNKKKLYGYHFHLNMIKSRIS